MVEKHVDAAGFACHDDFFLASDEGEACAQFQQESCNVLFQLIFQLFLGVLLGEFDESKIISILGYLLR